jgi:hypothetical protein
MKKSQSKAFQSLDFQRIEANQQIFKESKKHNAFVKSMGECTFKPNINTFDKEKIEKQ